MTSNLVKKAKKPKGDKDETTPNKVHWRVRGKFPFSNFLNPNKSHWKQQKMHHSNSCAVEDTTTTYTCVLFDCERHCRSHIVSMSSSCSSGQIIFSMCTFTFLPHKIAILQRMYIELQKHTHMIKIRWLDHSRPPLSIQVLLILQS